MPRDPAGLDAPPPPETNRALAAQRGAWPPLPRLLTYARATSLRVRSQTRISLDISSPYSFYRTCTGFQLVDDVAVHASRNHELNALVSHALEQPFTVRIDEVDVRQHERHFRGWRGAQDRAPMLFA